MYKYRLLEHDSGNQVQRLYQNLECNPCTRPLIKNNRRYRAELVGIFPHNGRVYGSSDDKTKGKRFRSDKVLDLEVGIRLLFENRPALYFCNYKLNEVNNTRMLDTLFIEDFIGSMEEYFHF